MPDFGTTVGLASNALVSLERVKEYLGLGTDTSRDSLLIKLINSYSTAIETYCYRKLKSQQHTETHWNVLNAIFAKNYPITAITSVTPAGEAALPTADYKNMTTYIELKSKASRAVTVIYTAGFTTIPADLQHWTTKWIGKEFFDFQEQATGKTGQRQGNLQFNYAPDDIPPDIKSGINLYRKVMV
ncbi:MAG: phage head-tail connector protein [Thermincolia bacterium]